MKILQCHTKGDKRFSPFCCYVEAFKVTRSIENHYQCAKRFKGMPHPQSWRDAKQWQKRGIERICLELPNGLQLPPDSKQVTDLAIQWYIAFLNMGKNLLERPDHECYSTRFTYY
jgi:hypothetical protein